MNRYLDTPQRRDLLLALLDPKLFRDIDVIRNTETRYLIDDFRAILRTLGIDLAADTREESLKFEQALQSLSSRPTGCVCPDCGKPRDVRQAPENPTHPADFAHCNTDDASAFRQLAVTAYLESMRGLRR